MIYHMNCTDEGRKFMARRMNLFEAGDMQKEIEEKFGVHLHIHDQCGTDLWFHMEEPNEEVREFIENYMKENNHNLKVSDDGVEFTVFS